MRKIGTHLAHSRHKFQRAGCLSTGTSAPATDGRLVFATVGAVALNTILRTIIVTMLLLILGMGPLRILDGAHWPSDVLAGYALGLAWTITVLVTRGRPCSEACPLHEDCGIQATEKCRGAGL